MFNKYSGLCRKTNFVIFLVFLENLTFTRLIVVWGNGDEATLYRLTIQLIFSWNFPRFMSSWHPQDFSTLQNKHRIKPACKTSLSCKTSTIPTLNMHANKETESPLCFYSSLHVGCVRLQIYIRINFCRYLFV